MDNVKILLKAIILREGRILAIKRSKDDFFRPNCWDLPGGKLEFGEDATSGILREIKEETNLSVRNIRPLHLISELDKKKNVFWIEVGYICDYAKGEVGLSGEHSEFKWVTKAEFLKLKSADYLREIASKLD